MITKTRECKIEDLQPEFKSKIKQYLSTSDKDFVCFETRAKRGLLDILMEFRFSDQINVQVITAHQVIAVFHNEIGAIESSSMIITDIVNIQESSFGISYAVAVRGHNKTEIKCRFASQQDSHKFAEILRGTLEKAKTPDKSSIVNSIPNTEDRLRTLTQWHKDGLIDDDEFQQKRKEILNQL